MSYLYDIFISYPSSDISVKPWVEGIFSKLLRNELATHLGHPSDELSIFIQNQSIQSGQKWEELILDGLHYSKCMIPILSQTYFSSPWCCREIATLIKRTETLKIASPQNNSEPKIILPVLFKKKDALIKIPKKIEKLQFCDKFCHYTFEYPNGSDAYLKLAQEIRKWVENELWPALNNAPAWDNSFIISCYDNTLDTREKAVLDPAIQDYYVHPFGVIKKQSMS